MLVELELKNPNIQTLRGTLKKTKENVKQITEFLKRMGSTYWVFGFENASSEHFHLVYNYTTELSNHKLNKLINEVLDISGAGFQKSKVKTTAYRSIQYAIKDGDYMFDGFPQSFIDKIYVQSTKKFKKVEFQEALNEIEKKYYQDEYKRFKHFALAYNNLRLQYGQKPNANSQLAYLRFHKQKKNPKDAEHWVDYLMDKISPETI